MKETVLYIGNFSIVNLNAPGKRVYGNSKLFKELGYNVICVGMEKKVESTVFDDTKIQIEDGIESYRIPLTSGLERLRLKKYFKLFKSVYKNLNEKNDIKIIVIYESWSTAGWNKKVIDWCHKRGIRVFVDCVDWLSYKTTDIIFTLFMKWNTYRQITMVNPKADGIISISEFFYNLYNKKCRTVIIPPLAVNAHNSGLVPSNNKELRLIYMGIPFRMGSRNADPKYFKDRIDLMINILYNVHKESSGFRFDIYGFRENDLLEVLKPAYRKKITRMLNELAGLIEFHGHVDNRIIQDKLKYSDFVFLWRDKKRDTMAGFPTKISEALSSGIPVLTNDTSDLKHYVRNGVNGYICSESDIEKTIVDLIDDVSKRKEIKENCMDNDEFYYKKHIRKMEWLIEPRI